MFGRILVSLIAISALAGCVSLGGLSLFTENADNGANTFTSGSVDISTSPASAFITMDNMAPGDSVTDKVTVTDGGTLEMRYAMTTATTDVDGLHLDDALTLVIKTVGTDCATFDGTQLYTGTLADGAFGDPSHRRGRRRQGTGGQRQRRPVLQSDASFERNRSRGRCHYRDVHVRR